MNPPRDEALTAQPDAEQHVGDNGSLLDPQPTLPFESYRTNQVEDDEFATLKFDTGQLGAETTETDVTDGEDLTEEAIAAYEEDLAGQQEASEIQDEYEGEWGEEEEGYSYGIRNIFLGANKRRLAAYAGVAIAGVTAATLFLGNNSDGSEEPIYDSPIEDSDGEFTNTTSVDEYLAAQIAAENKEYSDPAIIGTVPKRLEFGYEDYPPLPEFKPVLMTGETPEEVLKQFTENEWCMINARDDDMALRCAEHIVGSLGKAGELGQKLVNSIAAMRSYIEDLQKIAGNENYQTAIKRTVVPGTIMRIGYNLEFENEETYYFVAGNKETGSDHFVFERSTDVAEGIAPSDAVPTDIWVLRKADAIELGRAS